MLEKKALQPYVSFRGPARGPSEYLECLPVSPACWVADHLWTPESGLDCYPAAVWSLSATSHVLCHEHIVLMPVSLSTKWVQGAHSGVLQESREVTNPCGQETALEPPVPGSGLPATSKFN